MESDPVLLKIFDVLVEIKELLAKAPAQASRATSSFATPSAAQAEIPQPSELCDDPESVTVFFGKNNGVALGKLSERSCEWYAQEQAPKLDSSGRPYPERPQERTLKNAARQIYHTRKGTLQSKEPAKTEPPPRSGAGATTTVDDSEIPFGRRDFDHG